MGTEKEREKMTQSVEIKELAEALSMAQASMKPAEMNATNPYFKTKYADLGAIVAVAREPLAANGLSFTQLVSSPDGTISVETILMHKSGQWMSTIIALPLQDKGGRTMAQDAGAVLTYLKRYSLAAILGIYAEQDTDGNETKTDKKPEQKQAEHVDNGNVPTMDIKTAVAVMTSEREPRSYGSLTDEELDGRIIGLRKELAKKDISQEHRDDYQYKLSAAVTILNERAKAKRA
jgi:hypothetical protein